MRGDPGKIARALAGGVKFSPHPKTIGSYLIGHPPEGPVRAIR
jgi:hypothetical protein